MRLRILREELAACALWCKRELTSNPAARLLVVTQNEPRQRGEIERALLRYSRPEGWSGTSHRCLSFRWAFRWRKPRWGAERC